jgi:bacterial leucyl aminopeptidase
MRLSHRALPFALAALAALAPLPLTPQEEPLWITLERATADAFRLTLAETGQAHDFTVEHDGAIVVARVAEEQVPLLSRLVHRLHRRCGGFIVHASEKDALLEAARDPQEQVATLVDYTIDNGPVVQAILGQIQEANIRSTINGLAAFNNRYYTSSTGVSAANFLRDRWLGYAQGRSDVTVQLFSHAGWAQPSVIMTITGATLPSEVVVIGGHLDSINSSSPSAGRAPGADDDASGVASLTEAARAALAVGYRPARTVKFIAYAAEEVGLRGSTQIANQHRDQGINVVGVMQLDMTNYKGSTNDIYLITDNTNATQNAFVGNVVDTYVGLPRANTACGYACSDHASWTRAGFVASFPFEAQMGQHNPTIHSANDTLAQSGNNANHALKFARVAAAYLGELAKGTVPGGGNVPPTANAGPDKSTSPGVNATLSGSGSDPDGPSPLTFAWSQVSGPSVTIGNANQAVANVTPATAGTYVFRLTVSDGAASASDTMTLTVGAAGTVVFTDDFETNKGWTRNAAGTDTATLGLWERGDPEATNSSGAKQLGTTTSGVNDLVTARLAGASAGVNDVDGGVTTILSPPIALPATGTLTLTFRQYLAHGSNATSADFLRVFVVGSTTTQVLNRPGSATDVDAVWATTTANISAFAGQTVRIRIEAADAGTASLVEAAVDDVSITRQ